ncbi:MAG: type II 3-dehydroquinate dehydratase [Anaerolineales bacterium]|nr:type II 3-dehydroquinate dehydratase [Anaerolineales bacterium]
MASSILILHGPNLNMLGSREKDVYGELSLPEINEKIVDFAGEEGYAVRSTQSNHVGELIDALQDAQGWAAGVVFNPGGYTHTSVALRDAVAAIDIPVVEVHISNIFAREAFRRQSLISPVAAGVISGFGWKSYLLGVAALKELIEG